MMSFSPVRQVVPLILLVASACQGADKPDPAAILFKSAGPMPVFKIEVDKENLAALNKEPRKHVKATVKVGDETFKDVGIHLKGAAGSFRNFSVTVDCERVFCIFSRAFWARSKARL